MTVAKIKAAHPFILIEVHKGRTNRLTVGETLRFFSIVFMVTGKVPDDDLEKNATDNAGIIPVMDFQGFILWAYKNRGRMTNP
jgi:hypothetical protein